MANDEVQERGSADVQRDELSPAERDRKGLSPEQLDTARGVAETGSQDPRAERPASGDRESSSGSR